LDEFPAQCRDQEWQDSAVPYWDFVTSWAASTSDEITFGEFRLLIEPDSRMYLCHGDAPAPVIELDTLRGRAERPLRAAVKWFDIAAPMPLLDVVPGAAPVVVPMPVVVPLPVVAPVVAPIVVPIPAPVVPVALPVVAPVVPVPAAPVAVDWIESRRGQLEIANGAGWDAQLSDLIAAGLKPGIVAVAREMLHAKVHVEKTPSAVAMHGVIGLERHTIAKHREFLLDMGADVFPASAPAPKDYQQRALALAAQVTAAGVQLSEWFTAVRRLLEAAPQIDGETWITIAVGLEYGAWEICGKTTPVPNQTTVASSFGFAQPCVSIRIAALVAAGIIEDPYV
jgi:hypothetical protein